MNTSDQLKPLSYITLPDCLSLYLSFPGKNLTSLHRELCAIKHQDEYVNIKTLKRWRNAESRPRDGQLSANDIETLLENALTGSFSGSDQVMFSAVTGFLSATLGYDTSKPESAAAEYNTYYALLALLDIISLAAIINNSLKKNSSAGDSVDTAASLPFSAALEKRLALHGSAAASAQREKERASDKAENTQSIQYRTGDAVVIFNAPPVPFDVTYWLRHIKNGKDEFLSGSDLMPVNRNIPFEEVPDHPRRMKAVVTGVHVDIGFQFKCFARCDRKNVAQLKELLTAHIDYSNAMFKCSDGKTYYSKKYDEELPLIATSFAEPDTVWFILPNYSAYVTFDPFINNYFLPEFI